MPGMPVKLLRPMNLQWATSDVNSTDRKTGNKSLRGSVFKLLRPANKLSNWGLTRDVYWGRARRAKATARGLGRGREKAPILSPLAPSLRSPDWRACWQAKTTKKETAVLLSSFHLNGDTSGFELQTHLT